LAIRKAAIDFPFERSLKVILDAESSNDIDVHINAKALLQAINRVSINASPDTRAVFIQAANNQLTVKAKDESGNWALESLPYTSTSTEAVKAFFNSDILIKMVGSLSADTVSLKFNKSGLKPLYLTEPNFKAITLPVQKAFEESNVA